MIRIILAFLCVTTASAANLYVTPTGSGSHSGADWSNAFAGIPVGSLARGSTYYVAGGAYGFVDIPSIAGSTYIYFRKATASDHGTETGWNPTFGTSIAVFTGGSSFCWRNLSSYVDIDGVSGSGTNGLGFRFQMASTNGVTFWMPNATTGVQVHRTEISAMTGAGIDAPVSSSYCVATSSSGTSLILWEACYIHNGGAVLLGIQNGSSNTVQYCTLAVVGSGTGAQHCVALQLAGQTQCNVRYNVFMDALDHVTTYIEPQTSANGLYVYGNVFWARNPAENTSQGAYAITGADGPGMVNLGFFNNTLYGLHILTGGGVWGGNIGGANVVWVTNNIVANTSANFPNCSLGNNVNASTVSFANASAGDFHLTANTSNGTTLPSPFNVDPNNTARVPGAWSIGAYQFAGGMQPQPPTAPTNITPISGASNQSITPTLTASAYSDPQASPQQASQWQITDSTGATLIWSATLSAATSAAVPAGNLAYSTTYRWTVRYQNTLNLWSAWSASTLFTTTAPAPPATPTNLTPSNGATSVTLAPTLIASAYSDPQGSTQTNSQWQVYQAGNLVWDSGSAGPIMTNTVGTQLTFNTIYSWRARYQSALGIWSSWSAVTFFTTLNVQPPATPTNVTPAANATGVSLTPTLTASAYSDPNSPALSQIASQWLIRSNNFLIWSNLLGAVVSAAVPGGVLTNSYPYVWQARYENSSNLWSLYSAPTTFMTVAGAVPPPPTNTPIKLIFQGTVIFQGQFISN